jgi:hypothetical protein
LEALYNFFKPLLEAKWFKIVLDSIIYINPLAIAPQVYTVFTASNVEGIALGMWYIFVAIQIAFVFIGIQTKKLSVFLSMLISFFESLTIIIVVLARS